MPARKKTQPIGRPKSSELSRQEQLREAAKRSRQKRKGQGLKNLSVPVEQNLLEQFREHVRNTGFSQGEALSRILSEYLDGGKTREGSKPAQHHKLIPVSTEPGEEEMSFFYWAFTRMKKQVPTAVLDRLREDAMAEIIKRKVVKRMNDDRTHYVIWGVTMALIEDKLRKEGIKMIPSS